MPEKTQQGFTYLDWIRFYEYHPIAKAIRKRYKKKLDKLTGIQFMMCQGEMWRKLGNAYREFKEQRKKPRRQGRDRRLKDIADKQKRRAEAGRRRGGPVKAAIDEEGKMKSNPRPRKRKGYRIGSKAWKKRTRELGEQRF